jgi:excisionase family DNA binding protein
MNEAHSISLADSSPSVTLTVGQLREVIRQELRSAISQNGSVHAKEDSLTPSDALHCKPYLSIREAADYGRLAPQTIRLYIRKGRLKAQKVGRRVIVNRAELAKFLEAKSTRTVELLSS